MTALPLSTHTRGHKKRARTHGMLMQAGLAVLAEKGEALSISDIVAEAGVSNGTFYNYFDDRDAFLDGLADHVAASLPGRTIARVEGEDSARRFALVSASTFAQAANQPAWGWALLRFESLRPQLQETMVSGLRYGLGLGHEQGRFPAGKDAATVDLVSAMILQTVRRVVTCHADTTYAADAITLMLSALGVARDEARAIADDGVNRAGLVLPATTGANR